MYSYPAKSCNVAVVRWVEKDGIAKAIHYELGRLGYHATFFHPDSSIPDGHGVVFSFGPYGKFLPLVRQLEEWSAKERPFLVHWNTEGMPDLRLPWFLTKAIGAARSLPDRYGHSTKRSFRSGRTRKSLLSLLDHRLLRYRYLGDYDYAFRKGVLGVLADSSALHSQIRSCHGLPTLYAPWGSSPHWYGDLQLERDIDVLWMGNRVGRRRRELIDRVRSELRHHGVEIYMADNEENPFIFGRERTYFLNRTKITLNVTRTGYDDNFSRFAFATPNRSLVISETMRPHCPAYVAGIHYAEARPEELAETIIYYLEHWEARADIVENAYRLSTSHLTLNNSIKIIMDEAGRRMKRVN